MSGQQPSGSCKLSSSVRTMSYEAWAEQHESGRYARHTWCRSDTGSGASSDCGGKTCLQPSAITPVGRPLVAAPQSLRSAEFEDFDFTEWTATPTAVVAPVCVR